jgi:hypothetical protein
MNWGNDTERLRSLGQDDLVERKRVWSLEHIYVPLEQGFLAVPSSGTTYVLSYGLAGGKFT